jgi:dolichol-phosphate mannosyltransferase
MAVMATISIVTPFFNEEENLPAFRQRVLAVLTRIGLDFQIVLVDDHSSDGGPDYVRRWAEEDPSVCYLRLSRNCGSHAAVTAGLTRVRGDCAVLLAADLQDPPETIEELLRHWKAGNHVVWAARSEREGETWSTKFFSAVYYRLMRRFALPNMPARGADFLLMDRRVIEVYNAIPEKNTSFLAMILWLGFRQTTISYVKQARQAGRSKWTLAKKIKLLVDSLASFTSAPIRLISLAGLAVTGLGLVVSGVVCGRYLAGLPVSGWSLVLLTLLLLGGCQLGMLGILGEYLWRAYDESRGRPRYVIEEEMGGTGRSAERAA